MSDYIQYLIDSNNVSGLQDHLNMVSNVASGASAGGGAHTGGFGSSGDPESEPSFFDNVADYINNALTGERDLQRQKDAEQRAFDMQKSFLDYQNSINVANYERQLSDSRHAVQYYVDDLKRAGLNPALAASRGGSTSIPTIGYASGSSNFGNKGVSFGNPQLLSSVTQMIKIAQSSVNTAGLMLMKFFA